MGRKGKITRAALLAGCACLLSLSAGGANAALVKVGNLVLKADGGFTPSALPENRFAPIDFKGRVALINTEGGPPTALQEAIIDFDRDGRLETRGLPVCSVRKIAHSNVGQARRTCENAIVGTGRVGATIVLGGEPFSAKVKATLFNGPKQRGHPTVVGHAFTTIPVPRTYTAVIPVERRKGAYSYRARFDVPKIAAEGVLTHVEVRIGRRYRAGGKERSYASARCTSGVIRTHGRFTFADGVIIDGAIEKPCTQRP